MKPTIYVEFSGQMKTVAQAVKAVAFGTEPVERLVGENDIEADIAVTDSVAIAMRMVKETEKTTVVIGYVRPRDGEAARAFAGRFPGRVKAADIIAAKNEGEMALVPFLLTVIGAKSQETAQ